MFPNLKREHANICTAIVTALKKRGKHATELGNLGRMARACAATIMGEKGDFLRIKRKDYRKNYAIQWG